MSAKRIFGFFILKEFFELEAYPAELVRVIIISDYVPTDIHISGYRTCIIHDGECWENNKKLPFENIRAISTDGNLTFVLNTDNKMYRLRMECPKLLMENIKQIQFTYNGTYALTNDGNIYNFKNDNPDKLFIKKIGRIFCSHYHMFAISTDSITYAWGQNSSGQLGFNHIDCIGNPEKTQLADVLSIKCGQSHSVYLTKTHELYSTGCNYYGQLGLGDNNNRMMFTKINIPNTISIDSGRNFCLALATNCDLYGWGSNSYDRLGLGNEISRNLNLPTKLSFQNILSFKCTSFNMIIRSKNDRKMRVFGEDADLIQKKIDRFCA